MGEAEREWISICSAHREYDSGCRLCNVGSWSDDTRPFHERLITRARTVSGETDRL